MREELLTVKMAALEYPEFTTQKINSAIRAGKLKAVKRGKYYFTRSEWNNYLGIPNNNETLTKDLEIAKLKRELEVAKYQLSTLRDLLSTCKSILG